MAEVMYEKLIAVCNTGPLISALQCGRVDLLEHLFEKIIFPPNVLAEFQKHDVLMDALSLVEDGFAEAALMTAEMQIMAVAIAREIAEAQTSRDPVPDHHLADGEVIVLTESKYRGARLALLDELAAREVAKKHRLVTLGFPGVLIRSARIGTILLHEARFLMELCRERGTHYSDRLIEEVYHQSGGE